MQMRPRVIEGRATTPAHVPAANAHSQRPLRPCKRVSGTDLTTLGYRNFQITRPVFFVRDIASRDISLGTAKLSTQRYS